jgi:hypothetical protein
VCARVCAFVTDTIYVLAFATIMLHTDAHNPQVKKKMTEREWVRQNRGLNDGKDLPEDFLLDIYGRVTQVSFPVLSHSALFFFFFFLLLLLRGLVCFDLFRCVFFRLHRNEWWLHFCEWTSERRITTTTMIRFCAENNEPLAESLFGAASAWR